MLIPFPLLAASPSAVLDVPAGTHVKLVLQRPLTTSPGHALPLLSGLLKPRTREGTMVPFEVAEDVVAPDGTVWIPKGSPAIGTVIDSQVAAGIKPHSRLAITVEFVMDSAGNRVPLRFEQRHEGKWAYRFTRETTGAFVRKQRLEAGKIKFNLPNYRPAVEDLVDLFGNGDYKAVAEDPTRLGKLRYVAQQSGLGDIARFLQANRIAELAETAAWIQSGGYAIKTIADVRRIKDAIDLVGQGFRVADQCGSWLGKRMDGPQVYAPVGFPIDAVVSGPMVPPPPGDN